MSSITQFQLGPLKFERCIVLNLLYNKDLNLPYYCNKECGFIYNKIKKCIVGKMKKITYHHLSSEDNKWASILKLNVVEDDSLFNSLIEKVENNSLFEQAKLFQESLTEFIIQINYQKDNTHPSPLRETLRIDSQVEYTDIKEEKKEYIDDNKLNHQYRINMIEKFNKDEMLDFIKNKNGNVHECLLWCNWDVFNVRLVKYLVDNKILDPFEKTNVYDGSDATNLSFYMHCKLLKDDIKSNYGKNSNWYKTSQITDYLKCLLSGVCTDRIF